MYVAFFVLSLFAINPDHLEVAMDSRTFTGMLVPEQSPAALVPRGAIPTVAIFIVDASDSMNVFGRVPLEALNRGIQVLQQSPAAQFIFGAVLSFSNESRIERVLQPIGGMQLFSGCTLNGLTRLHGTVMEALEPMVQAAYGGFGLRNRVPFHVDLAVFTDGDDNRSTSEELARVRIAARHARGFGWSLNVYGFGVDAPNIARRMNFSDDPKHAQTHRAEARHFTTTMEAFSTRTAEDTEMRTSMFGPHQPPDDEADTDQSTSSEFGRESTPTPV